MSDLRSIEDRIIAFFEGELTDESAQSLMQDVRQSAANQALYAEYKSLYQTLGEPDQIMVPSESIQNRFQEFLHNNDSTKNQKPTEEQSASKNPWRNVFIIAILSLLIAFGVWLRSNTSNDQENQQIAMNNEIDALMQNTSSPHRVKAVLISNDADCTSKKVLDLLVDAIQHDESANVRIAALESLAPHLSNDKIRSALYTSMAREKDPVVLITYINLLTNTNPESATAELQKITKSDGVEQFIKDEAYLGLFRLQEY